jgi:hypothetical protein
LAKFGSIIESSGQTPAIEAPSIDISSAGGYGPGMTKTLFATALYYALLS